MKIIKNQKGVTLLEVLAVVAIIAIMSALMIPKYAKYKDSKSLGLAKTQLGNDIRTVQNYTFSTMKFAGDFPRGGYGIHFTQSNRYIIFADRGTEAVPANHIWDSGDGTVQEVTLPGGVTIAGIEVSGSGVVSADFVCVPPYGKIYINGNGTNSQLQISYQVLNHPELSDSVILNRFGNIE